MKHLSVRRVEIHYTEMSVGRQIYLRYVVIYIVLITVMLATELFYLTLLHSLIGYYFEYLPLPPSQLCGVSLKRIKDFKAFWPCSFISLTVKGIDNF